jgi:xanthine/uracil permease
LVSVGIVGLVFLLLQNRRVASFAVLLGMVVGWGTYALLGWTEPIGQTGQLVLLPTLFFWGPMRWDWSVVLTSVLTAFVLLTNLIASLAVIGRATDRQATLQQFNRAGVFTGLSHMLSGVAGVVGMIPLSLAAAVIQTTRMAARLPFMIAMVLMMVIGVLPGVSQFLASLPTPVAYAAMFVSFAQLLGFGLKDFASIQLNERAIIIAGCSLLTGIGMMFVPASAWQHLHPMFSFLFGNGLLVGVLVCLLLEHVVFGNRKTALQDKDGSLH